MRDRVRGTAAVIVVGRRESRLCQGHCRHFVAFWRPIPKPGDAVFPAMFRMRGWYLLTRHADFISKLIIFQAYGEGDARFRGYEFPVYARRGAADDARLCRQAGGPLWHHPRAMGGS